MQNESSGWNLESGRVRNHACTGIIFSEAEDGRWQKQHRKTCPVVERQAMPPALPECCGCWIQGVTVVAVHSRIFYSVAVTQRDTGTRNSVQSPAAFEMDGHPAPKAVGEKQRRPTGTFCNASSNKLHSHGYDILRLRFVRYIVILLRDTRTRTVCTFY